MSLAGLSSISPNISANPSNFLATRRHDTGQLFAALESGDLAGAQAAYAQLSKLSNSSSGNPFTGPKLSKDFAAIGQALQNGDLAGAQTSALQFGQDLIAANQRIRDRGIEPLVQPHSPSVVVNLSGLDSAPSQASAAPAGPLSPTTSSTGSISSGSTGGTAAPEIVINLGGANRSIDLNVNGSQIDINPAKTGAGGKSPSEVDLNFGSAATGSQIEINPANNSSGKSSETIGINIVA